MYKTNLADLKEAFVVQIENLKEGDDYTIQRRVPQEN